MSERPFGASVKSEPGRLLACAPWERTDQRCATPGTKDLPLLWPQLGCGVSGLAKPKILVPLTEILKCGLSIADHSEQMVSCFWIKLRTMVSILLRFRKPILLNNSVFRLTMFAETKGGSWSMLRSRILAIEVVLPWQFSCPLSPLFKRKSLPRNTRLLFVVFKGNNGISMLWFIIGIILIRGMKAFWTLLTFLKGIAPTLGSLLWLVI